VGVDNSHALIEAARQRAEHALRQVEFRVADARQLDFADNTFDGCRADRIFMHLPDRESVLAEMIRVTRPGGWIVVSDPDWDTLVLEAPDKYLTRQILAVVADDVVHAWSGRELYKLFLQSGLGEVSIADTFTLVLTDFATADQLYQLEAAVALMEATGVISAEKASPWLGYLKQADQVGHFFSAVTGFTVVGQKRAASAGEAT
jgi:SAM-dependent methyltransferase